MGGYRNFLWVVDSSGWLHGKISEKINVISQREAISHQPSLEAAFCGKEGLHEVKRKGMQSILTIVNDRLS